MARKRDSKERASAVGGPSHPAEKALAALCAVLDASWFAWACLMVFVGFVAWVVMAPIIDPDFGWHAALGRYMVEQGRVATTEPLSHTAFGAPMVAHEWVSQVIYHLVIDATGVLGLRWMHAGMSGALLIALFVALRRLGASASLALLGTFAYFVIAQQRFQVRPQIFHMCFLFGMYVWIFVGRPKLSPRELFAAFAVVVAWVNFHSGAVLFPALVGLYAGVEIVSRYLGFSTADEDALGGGDIRRVLALLGLCSVALVLTPNHFRLFPYVVESGRINAPLSLEWRSILAYWTEFMKPFSVQAFWIAATATVLAAGVAARRRAATPGALAVVLFMAYMPVIGHRFISVYFAPIILVVSEIAHALEDRRGVRARTQRRLRHAATVASFAVVAGFAYPVLQPAAASFPDRWTPTWNFRVAAFPTGAVDFLREVQLEGNLFASADWGGYVAHRTYPHYKIFMDGRWVTLGEQTFKDSRTIHFQQPGYEQLLDRYRIDIILEHRDWIPQAWLDDGSWIAVFENYFAGVYLRNTPRNRGNLVKLDRYYEALGIAFTPKAGFKEQAAFNGNRRWALDHFVGRRHMQKGRGVLVTSW